MKLEITIGNQQLMFLAVFVAALAIVGIAGAYNPGGTGGAPAIMGHSVDEIDWSNAIPNLFVAGQVRITGGNPGNGKVLASDSTGLATWEYMMPRWSVKVSSANSYTLPSQFTSPLSQFTIPSYGTITVTQDNGNRWGYNNAVLFEMTVNSNGAQTKTLHLYGVDNYVYVYLRGTQIFSWTSAGTFDDAPRSVTFNLVDGNNLIQVVFADQGGFWYLSLVGDLIDNSNVFYAGP